MLENYLQKAVKRKNISFIVIILPVAKLPSNI